MRTFTLHITLLLFIFGCSDNTSDCLSSSGSKNSKTIHLPNFSKVIVHEGIQLEIRQGIENSIKIEYGENFIDNITTLVTEDILTIENSTCNIFRNTTPAAIVLTAIDINEIRNASQFSITSHEVLKFNSISLFSEDFYLESTNVGDFDLIIDTNDLNIISNNVSNFTIKGKVKNLFIGFYAGQGKFNGEQLEAQTIDVFHRGINTMSVNPIQKLTGEIRGIGDLISFKKPPIVNVKELYTGRLIFK